MGVTARRPSKQFRAVKLPMSMNRFLDDVIGIDFKRAIDKAEEQEEQVTQANCLIIAGWHSALGLAPLSYFAKLRTVKKVEEPRGVCIHVSLISTSGPQKYTLMHIQYFHDVAKSHY